MLPVKSAAMSLHVLLAAHPTVGHTNALRAIGGELRSRGHVTSFAITSVRVPFVERWPEQVRAAVRLPAAIEAEGSSLHTLTPSAAALWHAMRLTRATGQDELEVAIALFTSGLEKQAKEIAAHARRIGAAVVVGDYLMPAALLGARLAERPYVAVYHSALPFPSVGAAPFGTTLPESARNSAEWQAAERRLEDLSGLFDARSGETAERLGLSRLPAGLLLRPISTDLNVLATAPELEPGWLPLEGPVVMTGPCLPAAASLDPLASEVLGRLPSGVSIVYVSLGTVFNDKPALFRALIEGAAATGAHVVVSAGASFEALAKLQFPHVHVFRRVPQVALLQRVNTVITHGGNNTVQECLAAGRPMVVVPFGGDQAANAQRVERLGVGVHLPVKQLTPQAVQQALSSVSASTVLERAAALSKALKAYGGASAAAESIVDLVARGTL